MVPAVRAYAPRSLIVHFVNPKLCSKHLRLGGSNLQVYMRRILGYNCFTASGIFRVMASKDPGAGVMEMTLTLVCGSGAMKRTLDRAETHRLWTFRIPRNKMLEDVLPPKNKRATWSVKRLTLPVFQQGNFYPQRPGLSINGSRTESPCRESLPGSI